MGVRIGGSTGRFALIRRREAGPNIIRRGFRDHDETLRFLRRNLASNDLMAAVRRWGHDLGIQHRTDRGFLELLTQAITTGEIWVAEIKPKPAAGGGDRPPEPEPKPRPKPKPEPKPRPKPEPKPETTLLVRVKTLDGKPVEDASVEVTGLGTKKTDKKGFADFGNVEPGEYTITAEKEGHGLERKGEEKKDHKSKVPVPEGSNTEVDMIQHPECANVAFFEGPPGSREKYFGFDHKTNIKAAANGEYWVPVPDKGKVELKSRKSTRDETRWVSIAVGKDVELEINFDFKGDECIPCIENCTFTVDPANVAEVVTKKVSAKKAAFKIKGKAVGEAELKVTCDGDDIGRFYIWCEVEKELLIDVATLVTKRATAATYDITAMQDYLNEVFRQMLVKVNLKDLGTIDLSADRKVERFEDREYPKPGGEFQDGTTALTDTRFLTVADKAAQDSVAARTTGATARAGARRLYWYVPTAGAKWGGENVSIGHPATFIYAADSVSTRNTGAHEIGHSMKLRHPSDGLSLRQFAGHNRRSRNEAVPRFEATNTEPVSAAASKAKNVMANDPTNLMGYWNDKAARKYLRYHQWKAADRS